MSDDSLTEQMEEILHASYAGRPFGIGKSYTETTPSEEDRRAFLWGKETAARSDGRRIVLVVGDTSTAERLTREQLAAIQAFEALGDADLFAYDVSVCDVSGSMTNEQIESVLGINREGDLGAMIKAVSFFEDEPKTFRDFEGRRRDGSFKRPKRSKRRR